MGVATLTVIASCALGVRARNSRLTSPMPWHGVLTKSRDRFLVRVWCLKWWTVRICLGGPMGRQLPKVNDRLPSFDVTIVTMTDEGLMSGMIWTLWWR